MGSYSTSHKKIRECETVWLCERLNKKNKGKVNLVDFCPYFWAVLFWKGYVLINLCSRYS